MFDKVGSSYKLDLWPKCYFSLNPTTWGTLVTISLIWAQFHQDSEQVTGFEKKLDLVWFVLDHSLKPCSLISGLKLARWRFTTACHCCRIRHLNSEYMTTSPCKLLRFISWSSWNLRDDRENSFDTKLQTHIWGPHFFPPVFQRNAVDHPDLLGVWKQEPIRASERWFTAWRPGRGCNKLESPDDSEQCALENGARVHNSYARIPLVCYCHTYLMCGGVCTYTCAHFHISPPLPSLASGSYVTSLMNKSICDKGAV